MKEKSIWSTIMTPLFYIAVIILFLITIAQLNNLEKRLIEFNNRLQKIEDKVGSGRISNTPEPVASKTAETHSEIESINPGAKNFLADETYVLTPPDAKFGGTLTRWYGTDPKGLNLIINNDGEMHQYLSNYVNTEYIARRSRANPDIWVKMLADRVEITNDYKKYTIYLKKGVKWHTPRVDWSNPRYNWLKGDHYLTAKDVKFSIDVILNRQVECPQLRNYYEDLDSVKIINDQVVVVKWKKKTYNSIAFTLGLYIIPEFIYACDEDGKPFPKEIFGLKFNQHWYNQKAIGCGPYEFISYELGSEIRMRRFEDYYGPKSAIENIDNLIYPDMKQNLLKLKSKVQDFGILYPYDYREEILNGKPDSPFKNGSIKTGWYDEMVYTYLGWNNEHPIFKDKLARTAMSHALNRRYMLKNIFLDMGTLITGPFYVKSSANDKTLPQIEFDLAKSKDLLAKAGWKDIDGDGILEKNMDGKTKKFEFNLLLTQGSPEWKAAMTIYKEDLLKIGVKMNLQFVDWAVMQKKLEDKDFDAAGGAWGMPWVQDPYQIWHGSQASIPKSSNHISFRNKDADKIIEDLRNTFDTNERVKLYHKFHKIVYDEQPYTFFFARKKCAAWWTHLHHVVFQIESPHHDSLPWYLDRSTNS